MSRDRKPARKPTRAPAKSAGGTLIGIFIGLVFGALIAAGAAWYFTRANPFQPAPVAPRVQAPADQGPAALPGKPGDRPVVKQDFEFYKILPQGDNVPSQAAPQAAQVQSLALLPLRDGAIDSTEPAFGLLVLGSHDPARFDAAMGTEFLTRMAELASAALSRLR